SLRLYHAHLLSHMVFPFEASWDTPIAQALFKDVKVQRLLPVEPGNSKNGLVCEVDSAEGRATLPLAVLQADPDTPPGRLLSDYVYWMENYDRQRGVLPFPGGEGPRVPLGKVLVYSGLTGAIYGATLGAIAAAIDEARLAMIIGAAAGALVLGLLGRKWGMIYAALNRTTRGPLMGMLLGLGLGGALGVLLGALAVAVGGPVAGRVLADGLARKTRRRGVKFLGGLLGACIGGVVLAVTSKREEAVAGALVGALVGVAGGLLAVLVALMTLVALLSRRRP